MGKLVGIAVIGIALAGCGSTRTVHDVQKVTVTVPHDVTPQSCKDALAQADLLFGVMHDFGLTILREDSAVGEILNAAANSDIAGITAGGAKLRVATAEINAETARVGALTPAYHRDSAACSGS